MLARSLSIPKLRSILNGERGLDAEAFSLLYQKQADPVYNYVRYRVGDDEADDVTAEIFTRAWSKRGSYDPEKGTPKTWLWAIGRNVVIDHFRSRRPSPVQLSDELAATTRVPAEVERREAWRRVRNALSGLRPIEQDIISLRFGAGETNRAIAAMLGFSEANVAQTLRRALRKLRKELDNL